MARLAFLFLLGAMSLACTEKTTDEPKTLKGCLERPGSLSPPEGKLPCELVPPGLELSGGR